MSFPPSVLNHDVGWNEEDDVHVLYIAWCHYLTQMEAFTKLFCVQVPCVCIHLNYLSPFYATCARSVVANLSFWTNISPQLYN